MFQDVPQTSGDKLDNLNCWEGNYFYAKPHWDML